MKVPNLQYKFLVETTGVTKDGFQYKIVWFSFLIDGKEFVRSFLLPR